MKLLFDTNVIISGSVTRGSSFDVIKDAIYRHDVYYTDSLLKEIQESLNKLPLSNSIKHFTIFIIKKYFIKGEPSVTAEEICRDPDDNKILADALTNEIEILITGDKDLLILKNYKGIKIISPKEYWNL